jgi:lia operon protein LiaI
LKLNGKNGFALVLIACGALILLNRIGWGLGHLMGLIVPAAMLIFGYIGLKNGKKWIGGILMFLGAIILFGKLSGFIGLIIAIGLIAYGVSALKKSSAY